MKKVIIPILLLIIFYFIFYSKKEENINRIRYEMELAPLNLKLDTLVNLKKENKILYIDKREMVLNDTILNQNSIVLDYIETADNLIENLEMINTTQREIIRVSEVYIEDLESENKRLKRRLKWIGVGIITTSVLIIILK